MISAFLVIILSIMFGMYLGVKWARGEDIYQEMTSCVFKIKRFLRKILKS